MYILTLIIYIRGPYFVTLSRASKISEPALVSFLLLFNTHRKQPPTSFKEKKKTNKKNIKGHVVNTKENEKRKNKGMFG